MNEGKITALTGQYAMQMKPWVRLISVLAFIGGVLMILIGGGIALVGTLAGAAVRESGASRIGMLGGATLGGIYALVGAVLYLPPAVFLHRTAGAIKRMATGDPTSALEDVLKNQKSFWRFVGILSLLCLVLTVLLFVGGIGAAMLIPSLARPQ